MMGRATSSATPGMFVALRLDQENENPVSLERTIATDASLFQLDAR